MRQSIENVFFVKGDVVSAERAQQFGLEIFSHVMRFEAKRLKGEWFKLSPTDVRAFKRWKTIA